MSFVLIYSKAMTGEINDFYAAMVKCQAKKGNCDIWSDSNDFASLSIASKHPWHLQDTKSLGG